MQGVPAAPVARLARGEQGRSVRCAQFGGWSLAGRLGCGWGGLGGV